MNILQSLLFFAVSLCASVAGAICGIGGGVIIKPVLDVFGWASVATISFLSGCTVLSMSCYSVTKSLRSRSVAIDLRVATLLAIGGAVGGVAGKQMFSAITALFENPNTVGAVQAVCLAGITAGTLLYTVNKSRIRTLHLQSAVGCLLIGLALGVSSSFLGIGGGPINLVVLYFFFSMDTKTAAANSLYIILFSQATSLISTLVTNSVPVFSPVTLVLMVIGGILGGFLGSIFNKKLDNHKVERLFIVLMIVIICISIYNIWKYSV